LRGRRLRDPHLLARGSEIHPDPPRQPVRTGQRPGPLPPAGLVELTQLGEEPVRRRIEYRRVSAIASPSATISASDRPASSLHIGDDGRGASREPIAGDPGDRGARCGDDRGATCGRSRREARREPGAITVRAAATTTGASRVGRRRAITARSAARIPPEPRRRNPADPPRLYKKNVNCLLLFAWLFR
jgi:hypothetical protein